MNRLLAMVDSLEHGDDEMLEPEIAVGEDLLLARLRAIHGPHDRADIPAELRRVLINRMP